MTKYEDVSPGFSRTLTLGASCKLLHEWQISSLGPAQWRRLSEFPASLATPPPAFPDPTTREPPVHACSDSGRMGRAALTQGQCLFSSSSISVLNAGTTVANTSSGGPLAWLSNNQQRPKAKHSLHSYDTIFHPLDNYCEPGTMLSSLQTTPFSLPFFFFFLF